MNSVHNHAVKQISTLRKDLVQFESNISTAPLSLLGSIAANLTTLSKTIDEYETLAKNETIPEKQEKAKIKLQTFRTDIQEARLKYQELKRKKDESSEEANRSELLNRRPHGHGTNGQSSANPFDTETSSSSGSGLTYNQGLHKERDTLSRGNQQLDEILEMGREAYEELVASNQMLRRFQEKITGSLITLGVSQETIRSVERRAFQDKWIFYGGAFVMFVLFYYILKWFGR